MRCYTDSKEYMPEAESQDPGLSTLMAAEKGIPEEGEESLR